MKQPEDRLMMLSLASAHSIDELSRADRAGLHRS
jgi:hypothetical protein